jgi:DNA-directed RNA polymerase specialized sigma24 family protein
MIASSMVRRDVGSRNRLIQFGPEHAGKIDPAVDDRSIDLQRALYSSNSRQFRMLRRVSLDEWSIADVAKEAGKSETAVTSELARARNKLRKMMIPAKPSRPVVITHDVAA